MAGTEITSTGRMLDVAGKVEDIIGRYNSSVNKMYQIGEEIDVMWDGESSQKFMAILEGDREKYNRMSEMLTAYVSTLRQDVDIYVKAERDVLDVLNAKKVQ